LYNRESTLFSKYDLSSLLDRKKSNITSSISEESENYILTVDEKNYVDYLKSKYEMEYLEMKEDEKYTEHAEEDIPADQFPRDFFFMGDLYSGKTYRKEVYYLNLPFSGDRSLLDYKPSTFSLNPPRAAIKGNEISIRFVQFHEDIEQLNKNLLSALSTIKQWFEYINKDLKSFNNDLENLIRSTFKSRKQQLLKQRKQAESLVIPLKKKANVSPTFTVPVPSLKKKIKPVSRPEPSQTPFSPDPAISIEAYYDILKLINDMGKEMERKPSVYKDKGEEDLRDHFLMMLEPHYEGSATGETFNKSGKTDILLRHEGSNLFVGECKFWTGSKGFLATIDQLLSYLTWRDSKVAVIMFVKNKDFTSVLNTAQVAIKTHPNFIEYIDQKDESWLTYYFHLHNDKSKRLRLALMLYHTTD